MDEELKKLSDKLALPVDVLKKVYKAYWLFIKTKIEELKLKDITEDEFDTLKVNFNIPNLGKLTCSKNRWVGTKSKYEYLTKRKYGTKH